MSESTTTPLMEAEQDVQIEFRDGLTSAEHDLAERSVASMLYHSSDAIGRAREDDARRARLEAAVNAPLAKSIYDDPAASAALEELGEMEMGLDPLELGRAGVRESGVDTLLDFIAPLPAGPIDERRPPYDYTWSWGLGGPPATQRFFAPSGFVTLQARSDDTPGGPGGFVEAHAGYGVALSTDHPINLVGRVETFLEWRYQLMTAVPGSWADVEVGIDITAFEDPVPGKPPIADSTQARLWRGHKASEFPFTVDTDSGNGGPVTTWNPWGNIVFRMQPGRGYTFNVGIRAYSNRGGAAAAAGISVLNNVIRISMERIG
jgi:hypothetical protein